MAPINDLIPHAAPRRLALASGLMPFVLALALAAGPAEARVEDPLELLGPGVAKALEEELTNLHADEIDVVVTTRAQAGAALEAAQVFAQRPHGPDAGLVLVAARDQAVGVALAPSWAARGVTPERAAKLVATHMPPAFRADLPSDGLVVLVRELKLARALGKPPGYVPPPPPPRTPWELLIGGALALGGGAVWALVRRARRRARLALEERVRGERGRLAKLREDLRVVTEQVEAVGADPAAQALAAAARDRLPALAQEQAAIRQGLRGLADRLEARKTAGVADELAGLSRRMGVLHMGTATLQAAMAPLAAAADDVAGRLAAATARLTASPDPLAASELAEAHRLAAAGLTVGALEHLARACAVAAPVDPDEAWLALMSAPSEGPARAGRLVARWEQLRAALEAADARDREAGRSARDGLRTRLDALAAMLSAREPDLVRAEQLLDATERLEAARQAGPAVVEA